MMECIYSVDITQCRGLDTWLGSCTQFTLPIVERHDRHTFHCLELISWVEYHKWWGGIKSTLHEKIITFKCFTCICDVANQLHGKYYVPIRKNNPMVYKIYLYYILHLIRCQQIIHKLNKMHLLSTGFQIWLMLSVFKEVSIKRKSKFHLIAYRKQLSVLII